MSTLLDPALFLDYVVKELDTATRRVAQERMNKLPQVTRWESVAVCQPARLAARRLNCFEDPTMNDTADMSAGSSSCIKAQGRNLRSSEPGASDGCRVHPAGRMSDVTPRLTDYTIPSRLEAMALNIKNPQVERLAAEVAKLARESKTEAIGRALEERKARLASRVIRRDRQTEFLAFLRREIWPKVPRKYRRRRLTRKEEDALLGYGPEGV